MLDLSGYTFVPELTRAARYNGVALASGAAMSALSGMSVEGGGTAAGSGHADHAVIHVRCCEEAFKDAPPAARGVVSFPDAVGMEEEWVVRQVGVSGGAFRLVCERRGSRLVNSGRAR